MKSIFRTLVPATLVFGAIGAANAQSILVETDYPGTPPVQSAGMSTPEPTVLAVIQSNQGPAEANPEFERANAGQSRAPTRADASIHLPYGPGLNA